jgi:hypothetical protein
MMLRAFLLPLLYFLIARALWRLAAGILEGATGRFSATVPQHGVQMVRDPMCGTYVVPDRAVTISDGAIQLSFCSTGCRDEYRARPR